MQFLIAQWLHWLQLIFSRKAVADRLQYMCAGLKSWLGSRLKAYSLTSLDTSHDSCPSLGVSHGAGQLDGDLHRDSALNITNELIFVLQIQEITVTKTKSMCWEVFSNKYIYNQLSVLEYIVLWTRCVILVSTIANSRPGAPMNSDVAIVGSRWRHNCCHWLWVKERHTDDAIWDLRHDLRRDSIESRWFSFVNTTWLGPGPSLKWDSVRVQAKSLVKSQVKTVSEYGPRD